MEGQMKVQEIFAILHKWGIHTLGQLAALDKEQLGARLGPEAIRMWERANGRSNRLLKLVLPPESFQESFEFEREIETAEPLLFMLRRFLEQLAVPLAASYLVAKELTLRITFANSRQDEPAVAGKQISRSGINKYTSAFSKFRSRQTKSIFCSGCSRRIWRIFDLSIRSLPSR
jgi:nucleotidyltransferase/DNA polymerase involved in DNA repair